jgi:hypothetical protein
MVAAPFFLGSLFGAEAILVPVLDHFDSRHGDQTVVHHLVKECQQLLIFSGD